MGQQQKKQCPECEPGFSRREFMSTLACGALAASATSLVPAVARSAPTRSSKAESAVARFYKSLTEEQRKVMALPFSDERRTKINANWQITPAKIGSFSKDQQAIIHEIVKGVTSDDGYDRFLKQMKDDDGGVENYAVAVFGDPAKGEFEFELTGRHLTLRADGDTVPKAAFGGPIVYGHGVEGDAKKNLFYYQTAQANEVFKALEGKQREQALLLQAPRESAVELRTEKFPGVACSELSKDQQALVEKTIQAILKPYRQEDVDEVMEVIKAGGGIDKVHIAFYQTGDIGKDMVWDIWRVEGPTMVCHFRGSPHVHAYVNITRV